MKQLSILFLLIAISNRLFSQGCSDAGVCTIHDFNSQHTASASGTFHKHELDFTFNYATHLRNEKYYQPQVNYRFIKRNHSFFEFRLPFNSVKNILSGIANTGIGDITATYNSRLPKTKIEYTVGFRISLSDAANKSSLATISYPMYLQPGLGTTDLIAVANYTIIKYVSIGTGIQLPFIQYNQNKTLLSAPVGTGTITGEGYRRKPDALLRITGHYQLGKLKMNGTVLSIFHLADDYYNTTDGKYSLTGSKGTTLNYVFDASYAPNDRISFGLLYGSPFKTRKNIPDGLARSQIISPKITFAF